MERKIALCLKCGHKWFTELKPDTISPQWQCPSCMGYTPVFLEKYQRDLQHFHQLVSPEEAKKFLELSHDALDRGYLSTTKSRETKFLRLLEDLAKPNRQ